MKNQIMFALLLTAVLPVFGLQPRVVEVSGQPEKIRNLEIVVEDRQPLLKFAAAELRDFLKQATGIQVPVTAKPSAGKISLILGDCPSARAAGIDVDKLPKEGYYIIRKGERVYLAGRDDKAKTPDRNNWQQTYKRATLSAVYDFLERFAGVRFYFPGPYGTVVPTKDALYLPGKINIMERPDMPTRSYYIGRTAYYPGYPTEKGRANGETLTRIRLRASEFIPAYGHGVNYLNLINRFAKTHPEYFALMPDGKRYSDPKMSQPGQLCLSGGLREEIFQDAKAFFSGKPATSRGIPNWHYNVARNRNFNLSMQDWQYWCGCEKCAKIAEVGRGKIYSDPKQRQAVSDFMWNFTSEIAERLEKAGIKDYKITQHVYPPMDKVPAKPLHKNVKVEICLNAKGGDKADTEALRRWYAKTGTRLDVWTYAIGKHLRKKIPGIPPMYPRNIGRFIDDNMKYIDGAMYEAETDYFLSQYLNLYVLIRKTWNNSLKAEDLIDEHCRVMFGKGAPMMKKFYAELEDAWANKILGNTIDTGLGPTTVIPSDYQIWTQIYSPEKMKEINGLFDSALKAATADKAAVGRINFIRKYLFGPLETEAKKFSSAQTSLDSWIVTCPGTVWLRPCRGEVNEVSTRVSVSRTDDALVFQVDCEEPRMSDLKANCTRREDPKTFEDSDVEIMLNPSGDRKNYYQFVVNANGALTDYIWQAGVRSDIAWNSSATAEAVKRADGWSVTLKVPLKDLGEINPDGFPVNFCRSRNLNGKKPLENSYFWSPVPRGRNSFHGIEYWGKLSFKPEKPALLKVDFTAKKLPYCWLSGGKNGGQEYDVDSRIFITGGKSLHFKNVKGKRMGMPFYLSGMKPGTRYRLSCYLRTSLPAKKGGANVSLYFSKQGKNVIRLPKQSLAGTVPWHRMAIDFTSPADLGKDSKPFVSCGVSYAEGEAWFDEIEIREIE
jgi:hypothetical protein